MGADLSACHVVPLQVAEEMVSAVIVSLRFIFPMRRAGNGEQIKNTVFHVMFISWEEPMIVFLVISVVKHVVYWLLRFFSPLLDYFLVNGRNSQYSEH